MGTSESKKITNIVGLACIMVSIIATYQVTGMWLYARYMGVESYYSHGFIVPFVSLFFIYQKKEHLSQTEQKTSMIGLLIFLFALFLHVLGTILYVFSISGFSIFLLVVGLSLFLFGYEVFKIIWFPLVFLIFMLPLPEAAINIVSFPLKVFVAKAGVWLVGLFGVPVHGEGFNIYIPAGHLLVGNPCSGLRSLIAFLALGAVVAYMTPVSVVRKGLIVSLTIPIAFLSNMIRVPILILVSHYWGVDAAATDTLVHSGSGMLVFILGFVLLLAVVKGLVWRT